MTLRPEVKERLRDLWQEDKDYSKVNFDLFCSIYEKWRSSKSIVLKLYFLKIIKNVWFQDKSN